MKKLRSLDELNRLRADLHDQVSLRLDVGTTITVGMGTCGITAGSRQVMQALQEELRAHGVEAEVTAAGCTGLCEREPLVEIHQAGKPTVTYGDITPAKVPQMVEEHLLEDRIIEDWVVRRGETGV